MESVMNVMDRIQSIKNKLNQFSPSKQIDEVVGEEKKDFQSVLEQKQNVSETQTVDVGYGDKFLGYISEASKTHRVPEELIGAIIQRESNYNPDAVSKKGALGLMQLMPGTASEMGVRDPFNARDNILGGTRYFKNMLDRFDGDIVRALAAYNAGPQRLSNGSIPNFKETKNYVKNVLHSYLKNTGIDS